MGTKNRSRPLSTTAEFEDEILRYEIRMDLGLRNRIRAAAALSGVQSGTWIRSRLEQLATSELLKKTKSL